MTASLDLRPLGTSGLVVSRVGLGCNNFGRRIGLDQARAVVDAAIDEGVTLFDTADSYGDSEEILGTALDGRRDQVVVATKFGWDVGGANGPDWGPAARGATSGGRSSGRCGGCAPIGSTCTSSTGPTASRRWRRPWRR